MRYGAINIYIKGSLEHDHEETGCKKISIFWYYDANRTCALILFLKKEIYYFLSTTIPNIKLTFWRKLQLTHTSYYTIKMRVLLHSNYFTIPIDNIMIII